MFQLACAAILIAVLFERLAYYGIVGNLVLFLNMDPLEWVSYNATSALFIFTGISYFAALIGGWIADAYLGKFKTLVLFFVLYIAGYSLFPALAKDAEKAADTSEMWCNFDSNGNSSVSPEQRKHLHSEGCSLMVFLALGVVGIANGVVRVNISPFGADQVRRRALGRP